MTIAILVSCLAVLFVLLIVLGSLVGLGFRIDKLHGEVIKVLRVLVAMNATDEKQTSQWLAERRDRV